MCNNNDCGCFNETLSIIIKLQKQGECCDNILGTCSRPFLGNITSGIGYNTRPITLYSCCNNTLWTMPYTLDGTTSTSSVFRVETVEGCCATFRVLAPNPDTTSANPYVATETFFTMNLKCVGTIRCLPDTFIACI